MEQMSLLRVPEIRLVSLPRSASVEERFQAFHAENPQVYATLVEIARNLVSYGWTRCSMKMLFEICRSSYALETRGERYKLNNSYTAHYSRLIQAMEPDLAGFFETRERREN